MSAPIPQCAGGGFDALMRRENLAGVFTWVLPASADSVTVKARAVGAAGSLTITDGAAVVTDLFVGDEETWTAQPGNLLAGPFTVEGTDPGDLVTIYWTERL